MQMVLEPDNGYWQLTKKTDPTCVALADKHYSRVSVGASQFTRPGENLVYRTAGGDALWCTSRSRFERKDGFGKALECTIFRNESDITSSLLIKEAIEKTIENWGPLPADGMITYVYPKKVKSKHPGYSFQRAGFKRLKRRSKKGLFIYHITQERFEKAKETDLLVDEILLHLPRYLPVCLANFIPERCFSLIISRFSSLNAAITVKKNLPVGVLVSIPRFRITKWTFLSLNCSTSCNNCTVFRPRRSIRVTTSVIRGDLGKKFIQLLLLFRNTTNFFLYNFIYSKFCGLFNLGIKVLVLCTYPGVSIDHISSSFNMYF